MTPIGKYIRKEASKARVGRSLGHFFDVRFFKMRVISKIWGFRRHIVEIGWRRLRYLEAALQQESSMLREFI